jgi:oligoendopeptidase F
MPESPTAAGVRWDLSDLYASPEDPSLEKDLARSEELAKAFEAKYKPAFADPSKLPLAALLADYKSLMTLMTRPGVYAFLLFAERTTDAAAAAFFQKVKTRLTEIGTHLVFFDVGWNRLPDAEAQRLLRGPGVEADAHFLKKLRRMAPHTLAEGEEKIMALKSDTGAGAFRRLFDEIVNGIEFEIELEGRRRKMTESEVLADHRLSMKIRRFSHPMDAMNLSNEISLESVKSLVTSVKAAYPLAQRYYRLKKRLLGLERLYDYDRYAAVSADEEKLDFERCREIVVDAYEHFSPEAGGIVRAFFEKKWIDAEVRAGKRGGGFCCQTTPELHPYILVNYTGTLRDVMTVAHELGHGMHQFLSRRAGILESDAPLTLAETASVFGEMIVFERILSGVSDPKKKLALLCGKIDDNFATVFRQIAMTDFELMAHEAGLAEGELPAERLSDFWMEANRRFYGDSVELTENYRQGWKYIPHFVHSPFYCYAYAFAQLFVLALFQVYKKNPGGFLPKYFEMLSLGGSRDPEEIAAIVGLDIRRADFWQSGLAILESLVAQAEELAASA